MTATYERQDEGDEHLADFFGAQPVFDIDYSRAIAEDVVSRFRLAFVGVDLGLDDMTSYRAFEEACGSAFGTLTMKCGLPAEPFGLFMKEVTKAADGAYDGRTQRAAWTYLSNFAKRRALLADTEVKLRRVEDLDAAVATARGTLIFTQTKMAAFESAQRLADRGHQTAAIWGELEGDKREHILEAFRAQSTTVLAAPRVLDEGIDVPDADLGIVVSASNGRRQMIQRMGRILRKKPDGRRARLVVLYAADTSEDPASGAHAGFIEMAVDVAESSRIFSPSASPEAICRFLQSGD